LTEEEEEKKKEERKNIWRNKHIVFPRIGVDFGVPRQEGLQRQEDFQQQLEANSSFPFNNKFEKDLVTIIQGAGMTNKWTDQLLDLLGKEIGALHLTNAKDIEDSLNRIPIEVSSSSIFHKK